MKKKHREEVCVYRWDCGVLELEFCPSKSSHLPGCRRCHRYNTGITSFLNLEWSLKRPSVKGEKK